MTLWQTIRSALRGEQHDLTKAPLNRAIVLLAVPMVLEMVMESLFAVCDIFWVSKLGDEAVAAVGLTESVMSLYYALAFGLAMAATAMVSRRIGKNDSDAAARAGVQGIYTCVVIGIVTGALCLVFADQILKAMGAEDEAIAMGTDYARIQLGGNLIVLLLFMNNAIFRGAGDAAIAMKTLWLANGINIVLDPILIFGWGPIPAMGLTGAAVATLTGRGIGVLYQLRALHSDSTRIRLNRQRWALNPSLMRRLITVSLGGVGQMIIATTSWALLMRIMAQFGSAAVAGYTIGIRVIIFTILPSWGLSNAAATLVGQSLGAGDPDRAVRSVFVTGMYNMCFLGLIMITFLVGAPRIITIFTQDPEVARYAIACLRIISLVYIPYAWAMVLMQAFNGSGDTTTPTWINFVAFWLIQLPFAWIVTGHFNFGPNGVFWAVCLADLVFVAFAVPVFLQGRWKHRQI